MCDDTKLVARAAASASVLQQGLAKERPGLQKGRRRVVAFKEEHRS